MADTIDMEPSTSVEALAKEEEAQQDLGPEFPEEAAGNIVLVTDPLSFLGAHVTLALLDAGYYVRGAVLSLDFEDEEMDYVRALSPRADTALSLAEVNPNDPDSWLAVVEGTDYVIHTSVPVVEEEPQSENDLVDIAVQSTLMVLRAAREVGVKRVLLTSSAATVFGSNPDHKAGRRYGEADWADLNDCSLYYKTKLMAEKAAWDFASDLKGGEFELVTLLPAVVIGPIMSNDLPTSADILIRLLLGKMSALPHLQYATIDVRDAAEAHVSALTAPGAAGQRHILSGGSYWVKEMAEAVRKEFGEDGYKPPSRVLPSIMMRLLSWFDRSISHILPDLGKQITLDNTRMKSVLKIKPRPLAESVAEACHSLIQQGIVPATDLYLAKYPVEYPEDYNSGDEVLDIEGSGPAPGDPVPSYMNAAYSPDDTPVKMSGLETAGESKA